MSKSLFNSFAGVILPRTTRKREVSSPKSLGFDDNSVDKSLMIKTKNNKEPRIEPWRTPEFTAAHPEACPFKTLWYLFWRKTSMIFNKFPGIAFCFISHLDARLYQTLYQTLLTHHQRVTDKSLLMLESPDLDSHWIWDIKSFSMKKENMLLCNNLSKIFRHVERRETGV